MPKKSKNVFRTSSLYGTCISIVHYFSMLMNMSDIAGVVSICMCVLAVC